MENKKSFYVTRLKSMGQNALRFWTAYGKLVFLLLALVFASWAASQVFEKHLLFLGGIVSGIITFFRLPYAYNKIENFVLRLAWALINFALFVSIASSITFEVRLGFVSHVFGIIVAAIVCTIIYCFCSHINTLLRLEKIFSLTYSFNGILGWLIFYMTFLCIIVITENETLTDLEFEKVEFVGIKKWDKEIYYGNTYYVVTTEDGKVVGIKPSDFPEIRNIHSGTQIRVLIETNYNVYNNYSRLEIKN